MRDARQTQGYRTDTVRIPAPCERGRMRTLTLLLALLAILLTGCGSDEAASAKPTATERADRRRRRRQTGVPEPGGRRVPRGARAWHVHDGVLLAGDHLHRARRLDERRRPPRQLPAPARRRLRYIGIFRDANAPYKCEEHPDPDVSQTVSDYTRWLRRHPLLHVTKPRPVALGGLHGVVMDISKAPGTEGKGCTFDETTTGAVPFIIGGRGPASLHHVVLDAPGWKERLYLLRYRGGNVAIEIGPKGDSLVEYLKKVTPILQSLRFTKSLTGDRLPEDTAWIGLKPPWPA